jgi:hypothetical protein
VQRVRQIVTVGDAPSSDEDRDRWSARGVEGPDLVRWSIERAMRCRSRGAHQSSTSRPAKELRRASVSSLATALLIASTSQGELMEVPLTAPQPHRSSVVPIPPSRLRGSRAAVHDCGGRALLRSRLTSGIRTVVARGELYPHGAGPAGHGRVRPSGETWGEGIGRYMLRLHLDRPRKIVAGPKTPCCAATSRAHRRQPGSVRKKA